MEIANDQFYNTKTHFIDSNLSNIYAKNDCTGCIEFLTGYTTAH